MINEEERIFPIKMSDFELNKY